MEIYGEYLFAENLIVGYIMLRLTAFAVGSSVSKARLWLGSAVCGIFSFIIFVPMPFIAGLAARVLFCLAVAVMVFDRERILRVALFFFCISTALGGITIALLYISGVQGVTANGFAYMSKMTYHGVAFGGTAACMILKRLITVIYQKKTVENLYCRVDIEIAGKSFEFTGYVDSGNSLTEPISKLPVTLISGTAAASIKEELTEAEFSKRFCAVPYRAVGTELGILEGVRADKLSVDGRPCGKAVLCFYDGCFIAERGAEEYQVLLNKRSMERGLA